MFPVFPGSCVLVVHALLMFTRTMEPINERKTSELLNERMQFSRTKQGHNIFKFQFSAYAVSTNNQLQNITHPSVCSPQH